MAGQEVVLWDHDTIGPDDKLASIHTDTRGHFYVSGYENEVGDVSAYLSLAHTCNYIGEYKRKRTFPIPRDYLGKVYSVDMELSSHYGTECRDC